MISPEEYIEQRLSDQIGWYNRKSGMNQRWFKRLRFAAIVACCPKWASTSSFPWSKMFIDRSSNAARKLY